MTEIIKVRVNPGAFSDVVGVESDDGRFGVIGSAIADNAFGFLAGSDLEFNQHAGVYGESDQQGVIGLTTSPSGTGVYGGGTKAANAPAGTGSIGVRGETANGIGVQGRSFGNGAGVFGTSTAGEGVHGDNNSDTLAAVAGIALNLNGTGAGVFGESKGKGAGVAGVNKAPGGAVGIFGESESREGVFGISRSSLTAAVAGIALNPDGTGAGVYGESQGKGPAAFFKGDVFVTGDIKLINADCAEDFDVSGLVKVEPGTVMVLGHEGALSESQQAYDKRVAGVISGAGQYKPGIVLDKQQTLGNRQPIALMGKVFCKVDAQFGAIEVGDLLTTSPTPGHAMKTSDPFKAFGAVIGKALRPLTEGQGLIPILIALQ
jgi:hypothetical protein